MAFHDDIWHFPHNMTHTCTLTHANEGILIFCVFFVESTVSLSFDVGCSGFTYQKTVPPHITPIRLGFATYIN